MKALLSEMSWTEAKQYFSKSDIVLLPIGSNEQHGSANPLGTDYLIAKAIAEETAKGTGVLCLPAIPFGVSSNHRQFWGTLPVSPDVFRAYVKDVCLALNYYGVRKIVIVNGHGGNLAALTEVARELRGQGIFVSIFHWWSAAARLLPNLFTPEERRHAGAEETSVNLALFPLLVNMNEAADEEPPKPAVQEEGLTLPLDTVDETSSGVFGRQTTASVGKGKEVFDAVVKDLVKHVAWLKDAKTEELVEKPKV